VKYLLKTCAQFIRGKSNLEFVLGSQKLCVGESWTWLQSYFKKGSLEVM